MVCLGSLKLVTAWDSALLKALLPDALPYSSELFMEAASSSFEVVVVVFSEIVTVFFAVAVEADVVAEDESADADTLEDLSAAALAATALVASSWRW